MTIIAVNSLQKYLHQIAVTVGAGHCVPVGEGNYGDTGHLGNSESPINPVAGIFSPKLVRPKNNRFS